MLKRLGISLVLVAGSLVVGMLASPGHARAEPTAAPGKPVSEAGAFDKQRAQAKYTEGASAFAQGRFPQALEAFRASYAIVASPNSHLMIARTLAELGEPIRAYHEIRAVEAEAKREAKHDPKYEGTIEKAGQLIEELKPELAVVRIEVRGHSEAPSAAMVKLGGEDVAPDQWATDIVLPPGDVEVVGSYHGEVRVQRTESLAAGDNKTLVVDLSTAPDEPPPPMPVAPTPPPPPPQEESSLLPFAATAGGVGLAGFALFTIAGIMNQSTHSDLEALCGADGDCPANSDAQFDIEARKSEGKTQQTLANVGLVIGAIGITTGAALLTIDLATDDSGSDAGRAPGAFVGVGPTSAHVGGTF